MVPWMDASICSAAYRDPCPGEIAVGIIGEKEGQYWERFNSGCGSSNGSVSQPNGKGLGSQPGS